MTADVKMAAEGRKKAREQRDSGGSARRSPVRERDRVRARASPDRPPLRDRRDRSPISRERDPYDDPYRLVVLYVKS